MPLTKISKKDLGPLAIDDSDVLGISLSKLKRSGAANGQVPQWDESDEQWKPASLPAGSTFVDAEVPSGVKNGVNKEFTLAHFPAPPSSLQVFKGGVLLTQGGGNDYTVDNLTITFEVAPDANDQIIVFYRR